MRGRGGKRSSRCQGWLRREAGPQFIAVNHNQSVTRSDGGEGAHRLEENNIVDDGNTARA